MTLVNLGWVYVAPLLLNPEEVGEKKEERKNQKS